METNASRVKEWHCGRAMSNYKRRGVSSVSGCVIDLLKFQGDVSGEEFVCILVKRSLC